MHTFSETQHTHSTQSCEDYSQPSTHKFNEVRFDQQGDNTLVKAARFCGKQLLSQFSKDKDLPPYWYPENYVNKYEQKNTGLYI